MPQRQDQPQHVFLPGSDGQEADWPERLSLRKDCTHRTEGSAEASGTTASQTHNACTATPGNQTGATTPGCAEGCSQADCTEADSTRCATVFAFRAINRSFTTTEKGALFGAPFFCSFA